MTEPERESARAARGGAARALVWGHRKRAARAEHARALDGPPEAFDGLAASLYGWAVDSLAMALATVGGVGRVPVASGTFGSLVAVPLLPALAALRAGSLAGYVAVVLGIVAVAVWSAGRAEHVLEVRDHSHIVIDEVAGMVLAGLFLPGTWLAVGVAFLLFRIFDIVKPFPANLIDGRIEGGLGVVGDDLVAGAYAGLLTRLLLWLL